MPKEEYIEQLVIERYEAKSGESMKITVLAVGKIKELYFQEAVEEYAKRLGRYCTLQIVEVADERILGKENECLARQILAREGERIQKQLREDMYVIALAVDGKACSSVELARTFHRLGTYGKGHIVFLIGGALGLSEEVLQRADMRLSFSKMTFPHTLMRVILLEQVYRAFRILQGEPYHR